MLRAGPPRSDSPQARPPLQVGSRYLGGARFGASRGAVSPRFYFLFLFFFLFFGDLLDSGCISSARSHPGAESWVCAAGAP